MKNQRFLLLVFCLITVFAYGQNSKTVVIKCNGNQFEFSGVRSAAQREEIDFEVSGLDATCCKKESLRVNVKNGDVPLALDWAGDALPTFFMTAADATLEFTCENLKGTTVIKRERTPATFTRGTTLQDAIQLSEWWKEIGSGDSSNLGNVEQLLRAYSLDSADFAIIAFLNNYRRLQSPTQRIAQPTGTGTTATLSQAPSTPAAPLSGIFSPTLVVDALAKFAAKRFKQELTIAYLDRFRDSLRSPRFTELRTLFPRTFHTLTSADVFDYTHYFQALHENAQTDLFNLPENTANLVRLKKDSIDPQAYPVILAALDLPRLLETRVPASAAVEFLAYRDYVDMAPGSQTVYGNSARLLGIFSKHLHSWGADTTATGWAGENYLLQLASDPDVFNFWMALVLKQEGANLATIYFGTNTVYSILNTHLPALNTQIRETVARFAEVQGAARQLVDVSKADSLTKRDLFFRYTGATLALLNTQVNLAASVMPAAGRAQCDTVSQLLKAGRNLVEFAHSKRYGDAISVALEIFKLIYRKLEPAPTTARTTTTMTLEEAKDKKKLARAAKKMAKKARRKAKGTGQESVAEAVLNQVKARLKTAKENAKAICKGNSSEQIGQYIAAAQQANRLDTVIETRRRADLLSRLDKYGNLLVSLANAQTSDQLVDVLEKVAAPVQSYRKKREAGNFSVGINLYPGLAYGLEYQLDSVGSATSKKGDFIAFTTPVGVSLDCGMGKAGSLSVFVSLIDIGAVTAFRLTDTVSVLPELTWKNVFAPGLHFMWGIPKSPLVLGVGAQYGPALRKVDIDENKNAIEASHFRFGVSLTVDVPLFYLHSGKHRK